MAPGGIKPPPLGTGPHAARALAPSSKSENPIDLKIQTPCNSTVPQRESAKLML